MDGVTLVTLVGPEGPTEVGLPHSATVGDLIPRLAEICIRRSNDEVDVRNVTLAPVGGAPFPPDAAVGDLGMVEGDVLELRGVSAMRLEPPEAGVPAAGGMQADPAFALPPAPQSVTRPPLLDRTSRLLPTRSSRAARLGAALAAATAPVPGSGAPAFPQDRPRPADLSSRSGATVRDRVRHAWRATGYRALLDEAIAAPRLRRCATIAVLSPKGGVGKTTITVLLGQLLALIRSDRVVAVDTNPDFGSLGRSLTPDHAVFVDDILAYLEHPALTITTLDACLGRTRNGLMVLPAPTDPERMAGLDQAAYTKVIERLKSLVGIVILDCGTGLWDPATRAAITSADQLIVVSDDAPATASLVLEACNLLIGAGPPVTVVVNRMRRSSRLVVDAVAGHLPDAAGLVVIAAEEAAATRVASGDFDWDDAPTAWQRSLRELAALMVAGWPDLGLSS